MGGLTVVLMPLILFLIAVAAISPLIAIVCLIATVGSVVVLFIPARRMVRSERNRLRVIGAVLIPLMAISALAFAVVTVVSLIVAVWFYSGVASVA